jgi:hypothetical protein
VRSAVRPKLNGRSRTIKAGQGLFAASCYLGGHSLRTRFCPVMATPRKPKSPSRSPGDANSMDVAIARQVPRKDWTAPRTCIWNRRTRRSAHSSGQAQKGDRRRKLTVAVSCLALTFRRSHPANCRPVTSDARSCGCVPLYAAKYRQDVPRHAKGRPTLLVPWLRSGAVP